MRMTETVKQLLIINIIFYIGSYFVATAYPLFSLYYPENNNFRAWQPLTSMFMHAPMPNLMHIVFNMFALVSFGSALEHFWGAKKFIFFYISCGLGAALLHLGVSYFQIHSILDELSVLNLSAADLKILLNADYRAIFGSDGQMMAGNVKTILENAKCTQEQFDLLITAVQEFQTPSLGASGAIYGLLTAFAFMFPNAELALLFIPVPIKAKYFVPGILAIDLFLGFKGSSIFGSGGTGVAHFAHIGGALTGFIMMWYWKKNSFNKNRWD
ncbi:MAG: rhomboid family intramembrane serine protease [Flavobacterium sp.]|uniref:rhomboid family intramembrane serine protease n=1 Tax=Flavobacterium TaxID=237 RepID=UPI0022C62275|nr:rhomboid family intramembrane serine protease [Flavobacterium sp.]MCZ8090243.1 rhomboid family intramembrane serine protease [Flavobacterium sp.]MCZ8331552.1 rhomboid family intramembrane serine protease [Flavobacterium sp.]